MMTPKRHIALFMCVLMILTSAVPAFAADTDLVDINKHWAKDTIQTAVNEGLIKGYSDGTFKPDNTITRAEFFTLINRGYHFTQKKPIAYKDVMNDAWYIDELEKAYAAGYIGDEKSEEIEANRPITREETAVIIAKIEKLYAASLDQVFNDEDQLGFSNKNAVIAINEAGIMTGYPDGSFKPKGSITRAEAIVTLGRSIAHKSLEDTVYNEAKEYGDTDIEKVVEGDVIVTKSGAKLQNLVIEGNLTIASQVGEGEVYLDGVQVKGATLIFGGGVNSIYFNDVKTNAIYVDKLLNPVRIVASGNTDLGDVIARSKVELKESNLSSSSKGFESVLVENQNDKDKKIAVTLLSGKYEQVDINCANVDVIASTSSKINQLNVRGDSTRILGKGSIANAIVSANETSFDQKPLHLNVSSGFKQPQIKKVATSSSSGGSSGGGGGGGSSHSSSSGSSSDSSDNPTVNLLDTSAELVNAIQDASKTTVKLEGNIAGNVVANRSASSNLIIDFNGYSINGNLDITANNATSIYLNSISQEKISGNFIVDARHASVSNNVEVLGKAILKNVAYNSYDANKAHGAGIDVRGRARVVVAKDITNMIVNLQSSYPVVLAGEIEAVNVESSDASAVIEGTIKKMNVKKGAKNTKIQVSDKAKVTAIKADEPVVVLAENINDVTIESDNSGTSHFTKKAAHLVMFDNNYKADLSSPFSIYVQHGKALGMLPSSPIRFGYNFVGWSTEKNTMNAISEATLITDTTRYYAQWEKVQANTYTVTFESNGGTFVTPISGITLGQTIKKIPITARNSNYKFAGWYIDDDTFSQIFSDATPISKDITVYAKWDKINVELDARIENARLYGNNLLNVEFSKAVNTELASHVSNYKIIDRYDSSKEIFIASVDVYDEDSVYLATEALTPGKAYTVIVGNSKANFSGIAKDLKIPSVDSVKGVDTGIVEVEFEGHVDRKSAETISNYVLKGEAVIVKAELNPSLDKVRLTVEGVTQGKSMKLTMENILSTDGVMIDKITKSFSPHFDVTAPVIDEVKASEHNNVEVLITFDDAHGIDKATAEDVSNYSIEGLEILSAKAIYSDISNEYYDKVILTTSVQVKAKIYTLKIKEMRDDSTSKNITKDVLSEKFRGGFADDDAPYVKAIHPINTTEVELVFDEDNALDLATVLDVNNYYFPDEALDVTEVRLDDPTHNGNSYSYNVTGDQYDIAEDETEIKVILTVSELEEDESYKLIIRNIADNFGNLMEQEQKKTVKLSETIESYYQIKSITANDLEEIIVVFTGEVEELSAEDPTNYVLDGGIGAVKKATLYADKRTVALMVPKLINHKVYTLTVNDVVNDWGYPCHNVKRRFVALTDELDTKQPQVNHVEYDHKGELIVKFDEAVKGSIDDVSRSYMLVRYQDSRTIADVASRKLLLAAIKDDGRTMVFNAYRDSENILLASDTTYIVDSFYGVTDLAGNIVDSSLGNNTFKTSMVPWHVDNKDDAVSLDTLSQTSGNSIEAVFNRPIIIRDMKGFDAIDFTTIVNIPYDTDDDDKQIDGYMQFVIEKKSENSIVLTKADGAFPDDAIELNFNFSRMFVGSNEAVSPSDIQVLDVLNRPSYDEICEIKVSNDDELAPILEKVEVVDKCTILLHYSEKLKTTGVYDIVYEDKDNDNDERIITPSDMTVEFDSASANKVVLSLKYREYLKSNQEYLLRFRESPRDLANNKVADEAIQTPFIGVSTNPQIPMVAAKVEGSNNITIINDAEDFIGKTWVRIEKDHAYENFTVVGYSTSDELDLQIGLYNSLLSRDATGKSVTYSFEVYTSNPEDSYSNAQDYVTQSFTGSLEEIELTNVDILTTTSAATTANVNSIAVTLKYFDVNKYHYVLVDEDDHVYDLKVDETIKNVDGRIVIEGNYDSTDDIADVTLETGVHYKLLAYPLDKYGNNLGTIDMITEAFSWYAN